eukprot:CAMPEP_0117743494 /NCGR_PEP_ID=MMETSP0947-20121206/6173_1 /TAXON_ID=44440 /ORGANISM="Chattonella subsalsa, Strain CCMP2191" /LENGTH=157 /DNA_ID=CAMNT_0005560215 /DNA_START=192 /DNA_END=665 /DNA_ORIENTATION=+
MTPTHEKYWFEDPNRFILNVGITEVGLEKIQDLIKIEPLIQDYNSPVGPLSPVCQMHWESLSVLDTGSEIGWDTTEGTRYINSFPALSKVLCFNENLFSNPSLITGLENEWLLRIQILENFSIHKLVEQNLLMTNLDYQMFCGDYTMDLSKDKHNLS